METTEKKYRVEHDLLGEKNIPQEAYYGIHTARAMENFNISRNHVNLDLIYAMALVKKAAALSNVKIGLLPEDISNSIIDACNDILEGKLDNAFCVDACQGGAGTSTNMNVNEVIANRAIELLGGEKGSYDIVHPLHHVNCSQSTNDVYPTSLRIALIKNLRPLSDAMAALQTALQEKENEFSDILKLGRTQLMDALPMTVGQSFGAYAKAVARDRWRLYKVEERLRQINMGGTAIGTGINAPQKYIYLVTEFLQDITGLGLARSEYPMDITQNMDVFVEVSGLLKAAAVNLMKISNDLRFLSSGPSGGIGEYKLPECQAGSSIMPGKVNPVICEMAAQAAMKVIANDSLITSAACNGQLELNSFSPVLADALLESASILERSVTIFKDKCINGIRIHTDICQMHVEKSSALAAALIFHMGYEKASDIAKIAQSENKTIREVLLEHRIMSKEEIENTLNLYQVTKPGIPGK